MCVHIYIYICGPVCASPVQRPSSHGCGAGLCGPLIDG